MKQYLTMAVCLLSFAVFSQNEKIDRLTVQLAYLKADTTKVEVSLMLINELYENNHHSKALLFIDETSKLSETLHYTRGLAESSYYRALIYANRNDYYNAIDSYEKSRDLYLQLKDTLGVARVSNRIGHIELKRGNYKTGLQNSLSAIDIFETLSLKHELSSAYNNLAEAYYKINQIDEAIAFNFKTLEVRKQILDTEGIKTTTINIAELYSVLQEHRRAIHYYEDALALLDPLEDQKLRGEILPKIGTEYLRFKEYDKASEYLNEGLVYNRKYNNKSGLLDALNAVGNLNIKNNKLSIAEEQLSEAHSIATELNHNPALLENYKLRMSLDSIRGNYQKAFTWQSKYYALKATLNKIEMPVVPKHIEHLDLIANTSEAKKTTDNTKLAVPTKDKPYVLYSSITLALLLMLFLAFTLLKLKAHKDAIKAHQLKLAEAKTKTESILEKTQHLEEVNQVKDKLFSIVSHDLKDSISSIKAFIDLLTEDNISKEEFFELIPELSENANNASSLLFNLLNWSKSQLQSLEPKPEVFNIQEVFHTKIALVEQKIENKRIVLNDESQYDLIYADRSMVEIVIQNLITNAVKFSRTGDVITISNREVDGNCRITIEDTGVGIAHGNISKLFAAHKNFTTKGTKNEKGTGLGLSIAKDLVELNNGKIWVESIENVGSKFYVELPKSEFKA
ncbi:MAG: tetratricopeptide repeat-containing sensor histidine kinase [Winogradskyella arenosi]